MILSLSHNLLKNLNDLSPLKLLPKLSKLCLTGNPVYYCPIYKHYLCYSVLNL